MLRALLVAVALASLLSAAPAARAADTGAIAEARAQIDRVAQTVNGKAQLSEIEGRQLTIALGTQGVSLLNELEFLTETGRFQGVDEQSVEFLRSVDAAVRLLYRSHELALLVADKVAAEPAPAQPRTVSVRGVEFTLLEGIATALAGAAIYQAWILPAPAGSTPFLAWIGSLSFGLLTAKNIIKSIYLANEDVNNRYTFTMPSLSLLQRLSLVSRIRKSGARTRTLMAYYELVNAVDVTGTGLKPSAQRRMALDLGRKAFIKSVGELSQRAKLSCPGLFARLDQPSSPGAIADAAAARARELAAQNPTGATYGTQPTTDQQPATLRAGVGGQ